MTHADKNDELQQLRLKSIADDETIGTLRMGVDRAREEIGKAVTRGDEFERSNQLLQEQLRRLGGERDSAVTDRDHQRRAFLSADEMRSKLYIQVVDARRLALDAEKTTAMIGNPVVRNLVRALKNATDPEALAPLATRDVTLPGGIHMRINHVRQAQAERAMSGGGGGGVIDLKHINPETAAKLLPEALTPGELLEYAHSLEVERDTMVEKYAHDVAELRRQLQTAVLNTQEMARQRDWAATIEGMDIVLPPNPTHAQIGGVMKLYPGLRIGIRSGADVVAYIKEADRLAMDLGFAGKVDENLYTQGFHAAREAALRIVESQAAYPIKGDAPSVHIQWMREQIICGLKGLRIHKLS